MKTTNNHDSIQHHSLPVFASNSSPGRSKIVQNVPRISWSNGGCDSWHGAFNVVSMMAGGLGASRARLTNTEGPFMS